MMQQGSYPVVYNHGVAQDTMHMGLLVGKNLGEEITPGRFVNLKAPGRPDLILRRPISVNNYDGETGILELVYQVKGQGTQALAGCREGELVDALGPLGHGFTPKGERNIWLVGGGIGVAPLRYLPLNYKTVRFSGIFGYRTKECIYQQDDLSASLAFADFYTDDGSNGNQGFVTQGLIKRLESQPAPDAIYACGPVPMLRALKELILPTNIPCMVSMEERMGCGTGVCVACTCLIQKDGLETRKRVCTDGPVFDIEEVALHG